MRSTLEQYSQTSNSEKLLVRIERIIPNLRDQQEDVEVTFWKASEIPSQEYSGFFKLIQIC